MFSSPKKILTDRYDAGVHNLALLTTVATFPLICMGGLVTSHHAGMSVPDWPNSYGYNMFLFPPSRWVGGILYEHTHRLMGTVVGMLSIALVLWTWRQQIPLVGSALRTEKRSSVRNTNSSAHRYLALLVLGAVIFQGVLGGLRVVLVKLDLAIIHACVAQAFFCLCAYTALVTSRWWVERKDSGSNANRGLVILGMITVIVVYLQLIVGATMRHSDAGLAIPDLPLAYGRILPPTTHEGLAAVNHIRAFEMNLDPVTLTQIWLHFAHRIGAVLVSILVILFSAKAAMSRMKISALLLTILWLGQVTLGVLTVLLRKPADVASAHVAVGALVLMTSFVMTVRATRIAGPRKQVRGSARIARHDESKRDPCVAVGPKVHAL